MALTNRPAPALRRIAAVLVGLQALTVAINVILILGGVIVTGADTEVGLAVAVLGAMLAGALGLACQALWVGRTWPRGLVITWQVLVSATMIATLLDAWSLVRLVVLVSAIACAAAIFVDLRQEKSPTVSRPATESTTESTGEAHS